VSGASHFCFESLEFIAAFTFGVEVAPIIFVASQVRLPVRFVQRSSSFNFNMAPASAICSTHAQQHLKQESKRQSRQSKQHAKQSDGASKIGAKHTRHGIWHGIR
jgi:hypothetical protein